MRDAHGELARVVSEIDAREVVLRVKHLVDESHGAHLALQVEQESLGAVVRAAPRLEREKPRDRREVVLDPVVDLAQELVLLRDAVDEILLGLDSHEIIEKDGGCLVEEGLGLREGPRVHGQVEGEAAQVAAGALEGVPERARRLSRAFFPTLVDGSSRPLVAQAEQRGNRVRLEQRGEHLRWADCLAARAGSGHGPRKHRVQDDACLGLGEQPLVGQPLFAAGAVPIDRCQHGVTEPGEPVLEKVVGGAALDAIGGEFVVQGSGDDEGRDVYGSFLEYLEDAERAERRHLEVGNQCVVWFGEGRQEVRLVVDFGPARVDPGAADYRFHQLRVVGIVFDEEYLEPFSHATVLLLKSSAPALDVQASGTVTRSRGV